MGDRPAPSDRQARRILASRGSDSCAELTLWASGEAALMHAGLVPVVTEPSAEQYEITSDLGLEGCLDDFEDRLEIER